MRLKGGKFQYRSRIRNRFPSRVAYALCIPNLSTWILGDLGLGSGYNNKVKHNNNPLSKRVVTDGAAIVENGK